jgi:hypothetical protein
VSTPARFTARTAVRELAGGDTTPLALARAGHRLGQLARSVTCDHMRDARAAGDSWQAIGEALGFTVDSLGWGPADQAFAYAAVQVREADTPWTGWTCTSCQGRVLDYGPEAGSPADQERGHADGCERFAAAVRAWKKQWEDSAGE